MISALQFESLRANSGKLVKFGLVGAIGFAVDAGVLFVAMRGFGADPFSGRVVSVAAAMLATWLLNRKFTFGVKQKARIGELARYAIAKGIGLAANLSIYTAIVLLITKTTYPLIALIVASGASLVINFGLVKHYVFAGILSAPRQFRKD